jgi:BolA-like protein 3
MASEASITVDTIRLALGSLKPQRLSVVDQSGGCGQSFGIVVVSEAFDGQPPLTRQRAVHAAIGDAIIKSIHALEVSAITPKQFASRKADGVFSEEHLTQLDALPDTSTD